MAFNLKRGERRCNADSWKMSDLGLFAQWLVNERGAAVQINGIDLDGPALEALIKDYVMHGPYSDEALVRAMQKA